MCRNIRHSKCPGSDKNLNILGESLGTIREFIIPSYALMGFFKILKEPRLSVWLVS